MTIEVGTLAPDFTLPDTEKQFVTLSSLRGKKVVVLFVPFAFTGVCTTEFCSVRDHIGEFEGLDATVLGISVDSPFTLKKWKSVEAYNFTLLSDFNKEACTAYGAVYESFAVGLKGVAKRSAFVIDSDGIIRYAEVLEDAGKMPDLEGIKACLASI